MCNVFVMCGPAGCGKSTAANDIAVDYCAEIHSSDKVREKLYGSESVQGNPAEVFSALYYDARYDVSYGCDVIIDATSLTAKQRKNVMRQFKRYTPRFVAVPVIVPIEQCLEQNAKRNRHVPENVIHRMYNQFTMPTLDEGFDEIIMDYVKE